MQAGRRVKSKTTTTTRSEVIVEGEVTTILGCLLLDHLTVFVLLQTRALHDTSLLVVTDSLLEEVRLAGKRDVLHEVEGVGGIVDLLATKSDKQAVGDELDVLPHQPSVHAEKSAGKGIAKELLLNGNSLCDDLLDSLDTGAVLEVGEEEAGEVGVHALVTGDELVGEGEAGHETALLEPEDGGESTGEEDTLDGCEGDEAESEGG